jgi:hypothetical protein
MNVALGQQHAAASQVGGCQHDATQSLGLQGSALSSYQAQPQMLGWPGCSSRLISLWSQVLCAFAWSQKAAYSLVATACSIFWCLCAQLVEWRLELNELDDRLLQQQQLLLLLLLLAVYLRLQSWSVHWTCTRNK